MKWLLISFIRLYQLCVRPFIGPTCRFCPSCSEYARKAIEIHGCLRGTMLTLTRLCKCHRWHPGGHDPVPEKSKNPRKKG